MTLEEIYYIGQSIAVLAILASLIAIFLQMRQGQKMEQAATQRSLMMQVNEWNSALGDDLELFDIVARLVESYEEADAHDQARFGSWCMGLALIVVQAVNLRNDGFIQDVSHRQFLTIFYALTETSGGKHWWESSGKRAFSEIMIENIEQHRGAFERTLASFEGLRPELGAHRENLKAGQS